MTTMRSSLLYVLLAFSQVFFPLHSLAARVPVLPHAQGFGILTPAGRGGEVLTVTNLNDAGPGSLRAALETAGARTIVFEVGGRIELKSPLTLLHPFCTVAGQTAPDPGIMITGNTLEITTHDVLIQHLAVRVGDGGKGKGGRTADALRIQGRDAYNIVVDHLSASWSVDEVVGIGGGAHDITISNSIIAEPLHRSIHPKGPHGYAILAGEGTERLALIGNIIAHAAERLPRFQGGSFLLANCLIYNKGGRDFSGIGSRQQAAVLSCVGNIFRDGPSGTAGKALVVQEYAVPGTRIYEKDNVYSNGKILTWKTRFNPMSSTPPPDTWPLGFRYETTALDQGAGVEARLLAAAGSRPGSRNAVDQRLVEGIRLGKGTIVDTPSAVGGFPEYPSRRQAFPLPPASAKSDRDRSGYTDLEVRLHHLASVVEAPSAR